MTEFTSILCPIDFSETSQAALRHATTLAKWYDARLTMLHVQPLAVLGIAPAMGLGETGIVQPGPAPDDVLALMRGVAEESGAAALNPEMLTETGVAHEVIVRLAASLKTDLLVLGTHGRSGFNRLLLGSITEKVMRTAACPVLTVPPTTAAESAAAVTFKRILCATDFSPSALKGLHVALDLGRQAGGVVTVLHAIEYLDKAEPLPHVDADIRRYRKMLVDDAGGRLRMLLSAELRTWCDIEEDVVIGRAYKEILAKAEAMKADLIVMGAQGHGGVELMLYGSNTQNVVRHATCPVLTTRE